MPLGTRVLKVQITLPQNNITVTLDQELDIHINIHKDCLAVQQSADITITNLTQTLRRQLLSNFSAYNKRAVEFGTSPGQKYCDVTVFAGHANAPSTGTATANAQSNLVAVFSGQVAQVNPVGVPPNLAVSLKCYAQQVNKQQYKSDVAPTKATFKQYVMWAGDQLGVQRTICQTSYDDKIINNPFASTAMVGALLIDIQNAYRPNVAAFIDNNILIVTDQNKVVATRGQVTVDEFVGAPMWTEWGVQFKTLFNRNLLLACEVTLDSLMNPSLNKSYIVTSLDYELTSRDTAFYGTVHASPAA